MEWRAVITAFAVLVIFFLVRSIIRDWARDVAREEIEKAKQP